MTTTLLVSAIHPVFLCFVLFKVVICKISVLVDLVTPILIGGDSKCGLILQVTVGRVRKYLALFHRSVGDHDLIFMPPMTRLCEVER